MPIDPGMFTLTPEEVAAQQAAAAALALLQAQAAALGWVSRPDVEALRVHLGWPSLDDEQAASAERHLSRAARMVSAYTRGRGTNGIAWAPALAECVLSSAGRAMANPTSDSRVTVGAYQASPGMPDWTLQERLALNGWRRRAA